MKKIMAISLLFAAACSTASKKEPLQMSGAYQMKSMSLKNEKIDTSSSNLLQLKMYTADYMMYANVNPGDSVSSFGVGTYAINNDTLTENVFYRGSDTSMNDSEAAYKLTITKTGNGYTQAIPDIEWGSQGKVTLSENYESVGTASASPLDGLWKLEKGYNIKGTDTSVNTVTQFKMYHNGHFMFGHTWRDSAQKISTGMGYGSFTMDGNTKLVETVKASNYSSIRGQTIEIAIELNGADGYTQTITSADGVKSVEVYERVKR
jgi:hypothetical protein